MDRKLLDDNKLCHCICGWLTGTCSATIGNPIDLIKIRLMIQSKTEPIYKNSLDAFIKILKSEGVLAFYKGYGANIPRVAGFNLVMFLALEQVNNFV